MKRYKVILLGIFLSTALAASAQEAAETTGITDKYLATLDSLRKAYIDWKYQGGDTLSNPYLFQMLAAPAYYSTATSQQMNGQCTTDSLHQPISAEVEQRMQEINRMLAGVYATQPWLVSSIAPTLSAQDLAVTAAAEQSMSEAAQAIEALPEVVTPPTPKTGEPEVFLGDMDAFHIKVKRPNFWKVRGNFNVQLQQTYISDNWYKGGQNSYAANGQFTLEANYNNKKKLAWDNKLEARLGFQTAEEYNVMTFRPTNDLLRFTSKLGIQANKHWFYTLALQTWTQMMQTRNYTNGTEYRIKSEFMSPFEGVLSLGMDYKLEKKRFKSTVNIAPLALNYKHVSLSRDRHDPDHKWFPSNFGLKDGKHNDWKFGSTLTATASWAICKQISWDGRLYFFTDYKQHGVKSVNDTNEVFGATVEFENTFTLKINKYLSTRVFLYPRFDTMTPKMKKTDKDGNHTGYYSFFQFKEFLSFGLDVSF